MVVAEHQAGYRDDGDGRCALVEGSDRFETVHSRHEDVDDHHVEYRSLERAQSGEAAVGEDNLEAADLQPGPDRRADQRIVVDDEYSWHGEPLPALGRESGAVATERPPFESQSADVATRLFFAQAAFLPWFPLPNGTDKRKWNSGEFYRRITGKNVACNREVRCSLLLTSSCFFPHSRLLRRSEPRSTATCGR
jgi:hypothetical protein